VNQSRIEIVVGIFVLAGLLCLGYLAVRLGKLEVLGNQGYVVYADFASVAGLKPGDSVEIAGVKVGRVESIGLADYRARLGLRIAEHIQLQEDTIASVKARGLIGDKYIVLSPGASDRTLKPGDRIRETESPPDISDLIGKYIGGDFTAPKAE
jgi:phospholipid/cholesterol/gamma-HCH transport system substrate-binding protein